VKLYSDGEYAREIAIEMKDKIRQISMNIVDKYWIKLDERDLLKINAHSINDFPVLDIETLKNKITLGSYQLKNSFGYLSEHFNKNGKLQIYLKKTSVEIDEKLFTVRIQSRHMRGTSYKLIIVKNMWRFCYTRVEM
jgi:hypothetical protein